MNEFVQAVQRARGGMTIGDFADRLECSDTTVWRWENGHGAPRSKAHIKNLVRMGVPRSAIDAARANKARSVAASDPTVAA